VFDKARELGLPVKLHAEQLSNLGGAQAGREVWRAVGDHLEYLDADGVMPPWPLPAPWQSSCPAPSTPCAKRNCRQSRLFREHGVPMAVATDCNPGSSPMTSLLLT
jgi:imidazolonepropionase